MQYLKEAADYAAASREGVLVKLELVPEGVKVKAYKAAMFKEAIVSWQVIEHDWVNPIVMRIDRLIGSVK